MQSTSLDPAVTFSAPNPARSHLPWVVPVVVFAAVCILVGIVWDISWHSTIGRDSFWTPAHMVLYLGGVLGGMLSGGLVLKTTFFGTAEERAASVKCFGMRGPFGAWVCIWGALAMLTSAPFDNWWHDAYGLDVKILSPPHSVLASGMWCVVLGSLLQVLSWRHRVGPTFAATTLYFLAAGIWLAMATIMFTEYSLPNSQHTATYFRVSCGLYSWLLIALARGAGVRWAATGIAGAYLVMMAGLSWILALFPATPKLGPIYYPVTHMVPEAFPHLLIAPAIGIDLLLWHFRDKSWKHDLWLGPAIGAVFVLIFLPVQWFFAKFLISSAADNWFFLGNRYWAYFSHRSSWWNKFWNLEDDSLTSGRIVGIVAIAMIASTIGLGLGRWMARIRR